MHDLTPNSLREQLLPLTLQQAYESTDFYGCLYKDIELDQISLDNLDRLPIIGKTQVLEAGHRAINWNLACAYIQNTSGSTGVPLTLHRSYEEASFINGFFAGLDREQTAEAKPVVLSLTLPHHGTPTAVPAPIFMLHSHILDSYMLEYTLELLKRQFEIPGVRQRVEVLSGTCSQIFGLTTEVLRRGEDLSKLHVRQIHTTSRYITRRWKGLLERTWRAKLIDRFSVAEIFGGATKCEFCNAFHFDPYVVAEGVEVHGNAKVTEGICRLLITGLVPFVQMQPLIRYDTGDVFRIESGKCYELGFHFLGRRSQCLFDDQHLLLSSTELLDILDDEALVAKSQSNVATDKGAVGHPKIWCEASIQEGSIGVKVTLETLFDPIINSTTATELRSGIRSKILAILSSRTNKHLHCEIKCVSEGRLPVGTFEKKQALWILN